MNGAGLPVICHMMCELTFFYRQHESSLELAEVSKLLLAAEYGKISQYCGKRLRNINLDGEGMYTHTHTHAFKLISFYLTKFITVINTVLPTYELFKFGRHSRSRSGRGGGSGRGCPSPWARTFCFVFKSSPEAFISPLFFKNSFPPPSGAMLPHIIWLALGFLPSYAPGCWYEQKHVHVVILGPFVSLRLFFLGGGSQNVFYFICFGIKKHHLKVFTC